MQYSMQEVIDSALDIKIISEREHKVLTRRFEGKIRKEIGEELGVHRTRINQIEAKAIRKIRNAFWRSTH